MKVLVNASLVTKNPTGIGRWSFELTKRIIENKTIEWVVICPFPDIFKGSCKNKQVKFVVSPESGLKRIYFELIKSKWVLKKYKPDIYLNMNYGIPLSCLKGIKYISTIHDLCPFVVPDTFGMLSGFYKRWAIKRTVYRSDLIITVSENTKKDVRNLIGGLEKKLRVVYNGVDSAFFTKKRCMDKNNKKYILAVGTLEPRKNLKRLLEAFDKYIYEKFPEVNLLLVGNIGWKMDGFHEWLSSLKSSSSIKLLGRVTDDQLATLYQHAELFVYPSLYEGFGIPPLEALASGCPTIVSNSSSLPEVVGDLGIYVDAFSIKDIGVKITKVLSDGVSSNYYMRSQARANQFTWERAYESIIHILQEF